jgi:hypothetical protein
MSGRICHTPYHRGDNSRTSQAFLTTIGDEHLLPVRIPALFLTETDRSVAVTVAMIADWAPLEKRLPPKLWAEFVWMFRQGGIEHYKHIVTRRYLRLDHSGRCLVATGQGFREVPFEQEWRRVTRRTGGTEVDAHNGSADKREDERSEIGQRQETFKTSWRPASAGRSDGRSVFRRPACRRRQQTHPGTGSGKRAGGRGDRV